MRGDHDGIEALASDGVVGEGSAGFVILEPRSQHGSFDVEKRLRRRIIGALDGFLDEHDWWQRGQRHRREAEHTLDAGGQVKFAKGNDDDARKEGIEALEVVRERATHR